ncbi:amidohydrolase family protein [Oscillospiraceae bacterium OttesenSCG-928-G22]|nr:amidohydrolase family protein [Oscillospiraceae bacterium OttesenSCG-928-G22]
MAGGVILAVGTESDILALRGPDTAVIEAPQGSTVLPGLKDSHLHFAMTGRARSVVNLSGVRNFDEWRARLDAYRREKNLRPGDWIAGTSWDQNRMEEKRFPTKRDFDEMFPENPVFCARCCNHVGVLNSAGLRALGLDAFTPDPPNGSFERTETGELTGFLIEGATAAAFRRVFTGDQKTLETWISDAADIALRAGLTEVHPDEFGASRRNAAPPGTAPS